jgi:hypothetical protein
MIRLPEGFGLASYIPTVGLSARPRAIWRLTYNHVEVARGSKSDLLALLRNAATVERWKQAATSQAREDAK